MICPDLKGDKIRLYGSKTEDDDETDKGKGKTFYMQVSKCHADNTEIEKCKP